MLLLVGKVTYRYLKILNFGRLSAKLSSHRLGCCCGARARAPTKSHGDLGGDRANWLGTAEAAEQAETGHGVTAGVLKMAGKCWEPKKDGLEHLLMSMG